MTTFTLQLNSLESLPPATFWIAHGHECLLLSSPGTCLPLLSRIIGFSTFPLFSFSSSFLFIKLWELVIIRLPLEINCVQEKVPMSTKLHSVIVESMALTSGGTGSTFYYSSLGSTER